MPLRLDIKRKLLTSSDRVKSTDLHPTEPWLLVSLFSGQVHIWNHSSQILVKTFDVTENLPVRTAKFAARKNWIITGSDDMHIRVYNYNTSEKVKQFEAHSDYIRSVVVHPTQPYVISSSDDMSIKLWDWERHWKCKQVFEGHSHYVMEIVINPKDNNTFASASLDRTLKIWQLGSNVCNFTLEGHEKGVNCVDYYPGGEKPYLVSGADDRTVKIWDYQNKTCVQTLDAHSQNVSSVAFHSEIPLIITGSEDGTVKLWHSVTYRLDSTLNFGLERVWSISCQKGSNNVGLGYDEGSVVVAMGREDPAISMDQNGKVVWAKHSELLQANLRSLPSDIEVKDGERIPIPIRDMGTSELFPQKLEHNSNGRFVAVCGDGEYNIYTAVALRSKAYGTAQEFVWSIDPSQYAIKDASSIRIFKNFKEAKSMKIKDGVDAIFGGYLLGVRSPVGLEFYEWNSEKLVRRIEVIAKTVFWNDTGSLVAIGTEDSFYILKYNQFNYEQALSKNESFTEDGYELAFDVIGEVNESVRTGLWIGDCFVYTNSVNRLNYYVGGEIVTIAHLDISSYILGYVASHNRVYLSDKDVNIFSYNLLVSVLEYQTAVMRQDFNLADHIINEVPINQRTRVAHFLEKQGFKVQALTVTTDVEHKFDLAISLKRLDLAKEVADELNSDIKWKTLASAAQQTGDIALAKYAFMKAKDYSSLMLLATSTGDRILLDSIANLADKKYNVAFLSTFLLGNLDNTLEILLKNKRIPEAALFARTYLPSQVPRIVKLWKTELERKKKPKLAKGIACPTEYPNLFPNWEDMLKTEQYVALQRQTTKGKLLAKNYVASQSTTNRNLVEEMKMAEKNGLFTYNDTTSIPQKADETIDIEEYLNEKLKESKNGSSSTTPNDIEVIPEINVDKNDELATNVEEYVDDQMNSEISDKYGKKVPASPPATPVNIEEINKHSTDMDMVSSQLSEEVDQLNEAIMNDYEKDKKEKEIADDLDEFDLELQKELEGMDLGGL
ncbi:hypothetical protein SNEBB_010154 [Seison nebaliae]|nr:hypothetical protein SNEBB_010154 [Seison nebaliae]